MLTLENLPPPNTLRWSKRRKCELLAAIDAGLLSRSEACSMYSLSVDEIVAWRHALTRFGIEGLSARRPRNAQSATPGFPLQQRLLTERRRLADAWTARGIVYVEGEESVDTVAMKRAAGWVERRLGNRVPRDAIDPINAYFRRMLDCPKTLLESARGADSTRLDSACNYR